MKNADLHTHSYYSDGEYSPKEVVRRAKKAGVKYLALTDHNSVNGVQEAINEGKIIGVNVIPAVEVVGEYEILGYFIDYKNLQLKKNLKTYSCYENERIKRKIKTLQKQGIDISYKKLLKKYPYAKDNYNTAHLYLFMHDLGLSNLRIMMNKFKIKEPSKIGFSVVSIIELIKRYNGVPVLPHPWVKKEVLEDENFKKYLRVGLKGIELENGGEFEREKETVEKIEELAKRFDLVLTSGSDYHGDFFTKKTKGHEIGKYNCDEGVVEQLRLLREQLDAISRAM